MLRNCFLALFLLINSYASFGQNIQKMQSWQDSLSGLGQKIFAKTGEVERMESNFSFVKTLVSALKETNSFYYDFDKLNMISIIKSPDASFRIFSWNVPLQDGSYLYYGAIQQKSGSLKLTPLLDKTFEIMNADNDVVANDRWYGAQYYEIIPFKKNQYILLGWKGHHAEYSKKVIEVLNILPSGQITFGAAVFSDSPNVSRKIFSYTKRATMLLRYNANLKRIEFDNILPLEGKATDNFKYYAPDMTHNGYRIGNDKLEFEENVEVLNLDAPIETPSVSKTLKSGF